MLVTRECDYALRILRSLADGEIKNVSRIAEEEGITSAIAHKLTRKMEQHQILQSKRGSKGGYRMNVSLDDITLYDIFCLIDGEPLLTECLESGYQCSNHKEDGSCGFHEEICRIQMLMIREFKSKTIAKLLEEQKAEVI